MIRIVMGSTISRRALARFWLAYSPFPLQVIAGGQLHLLGDFLDGFFDGAAQVAAADAVFDGDVTLVALAINFRTAVGHLNVAKLGERNALSGGRQQANFLDGLAGCRGIAGDSA